MRAGIRWWSLLVLALLVSAQWPAGVAHHGPNTVGVIRSGPAQWDVVVDAPTLQRITVQLHADGARDIRVGLPEGLTECNTCSAAWIDVAIVSVAPVLLAGVATDQGTHILIEGAAWPFDQVLQISADVTITIDDGPAWGDLPFYLGATATPSSCSSACASAGAVSLVTANLPAPPSIVIDSPEPGDHLRTGFSVLGRAAAVSGIASVRVKIIGATVIEASGGASWVAPVEGSDLRPGWNRLVASVVDDRGRAASTYVDVYFDTVGPRVSLVQPEEGTVYAHDIAIPVVSSLPAITVGPTTILVHAEDDSGRVDRVRICIWDRAVQLVCTTDDEAPYTSDGLHSLRGARVLRVTAEAWDAAGNPSNVAFANVLKLY